jgi:hypothetical protein
MRTFLLTWNPEQESPTDFRDEIKMIRRSLPVEAGWRPGNRKDWPTGSRFFMLRQGVEPRGIFASGYTLGRPRPEYGIPIAFTLILDSDKGALVPTSELTQDAILQTVHWENMPASGVELLSGQPAQLETIWKRLLVRLKKDEIQRAALNDLMGQRRH